MVIPSFGETWVEPRVGACDAYIGASVITGASVATVSSVETGVSVTTGASVPTFLERGVNHPLLMAITNHATTVMPTITMGTVFDRVPGAAVTTVAAGALSAFGVITC
ncbi:MAG TPA: hypothetical protein PLP77_07890, partial [Anaerolineaceae bacterium]|nr:hypothetical protein [Anaerolineaceae bacterium]